MHTIIDKERERERPNWPFADHNNRVSSDLCFLLRHNIYRPQSTTHTAQSTNNNNNKACNNVSVSNGETQECTLKKSTLQGTQIRHIYYRQIYIYEKEIEKKRRNRRSDRQADYLQSQVCNQNQPSSLLFNRSTICIWKEAKQREGSKDKQECHTRLNKSIKQTLTILYTLYALLCASLKDTETDDDDDDVKCPNYYYKLYKFSHHL